MFIQLKNTAKTQVCEHRAYNKCIEREGILMFWRKKKKQDEVIPQVQQDVVEDLPKAIDFTLAVENEEERDIVSIIASAIVSSDLSDATVRVKSVRRVDVDKEAAAVIAAAVMANDSPESTFRLISIEERS